MKWKLIKGAFKLGGFLAMLGMTMLAEHNARKLSAEGTISR